MKKYLFAGDSITNSGRFWEDRTDGKDLGTGFVQMIYKVLKEKQDVDVINKGFDGYLSYELADIWQEICLNIKPDVLTILIGTNDIATAMYNKKKVMETRYGQSLEYMVSSAKESFNPQIILMTPIVDIKVGEYADWDVQILEYINVVKEVSKKYGTEFVDIYSEIKTNNYTLDGIHPNMDGHKMIAEKWMEIYKRC